MCVHWSGMGNNKKEEGKSNVLFLIWLVCHAKILGTPLLLHENVKNFSSEYLKEKAQQLGYTHLGTIPTTGADAALDAASRPRVCSGNHMSKSCFLHGVFFDRYMIYIYSFWSVHGTDNSICARLWSNQGMTSWSKMNSSMWLMTRQKCMVHCRNMWNPSYPQSTWRMPCGWRTPRSCDVSSLSQPTRIATWLRHSWRPWIWEIGSMLWVTPKNRTTNNICQTWRWQSPNQNGHWGPCVLARTQRRGSWLGQKLAFQHSRNHPRGGSCSHPTTAGCQLKRRWPCMGGLYIMRLRIAVSFYFFIPFSRIENRLLCVGKACQYLGRALPTFFPKMCFFDLKKIREYLLYIWLVVERQI